jgi:CheY-like chemotaxis protein
MEQHVSRRQWNGPREPGHRPRVLVEDDHPALAVSDFAAFRQAGFDVAFCSGPGSDPDACPLLHGQDCELLASVDAVIHDLDPGLGVCEAIRRLHPGVPVLAKRHRLPDGSLEPVPEGCAPLVSSCSVHGQIDALERAVYGRGG